MSSSYIPRKAKDKHIITHVATGQGCSNVKAISRCQCQMSSKKFSRSWRCQHWHLVTSGDEKTIKTGPKWDKITRMAANWVKSIQKTVKDPFYTYRRIRISAKLCAIRSRCYPDVIQMLKTRCQLWHRSVQATLRKTYSQKIVKSWNLLFALSFTTFDPQYQLGLLIFHLQVNSASVLWHLSLSLWFLFISIIFNPCWNLN